MSWQTQTVLAAMLEDVGESRYGLEMAKAAGLPSGTIYPMLARLEREGLVASHWEDVDPRVAGRRPRRYYRLTRAGERAARAEITTTVERLLPARLAGRIGAIEKVAQTEVGRNIDPLARMASGNLLSAAAHITATPSPSVVVLTGAYVPWASPPAAETDGPPGAAILASGFSAMGIRTRLLTDSHCLPIVVAAARATTPEIAVDKCDGTDEEIRSLVQDYQLSGVTHLVAVERMGPAADGIVRNFRGQDVTRYTAPLHPLMALGRWATIAVGDGGNELGMGNIPSSVVSRAIKDGSRVHCVIPCDYLIVSGVSNWGAMALLLATALLGRESVDDIIGEPAVAFHDRLVARCVAAGAVDGTVGRRVPTVDGLPQAMQNTIVDQMWTLARKRGANEKASIYHEHYRDGWRGLVGRYSGDLHQYERTNSSHR